jgi:hypothetical protein
MIQRIGALAPRRHPGISSIAGGNTLCFRSDDHHAPDGALNGIPIA